MVPHSSTLAWKIDGQRSLVGCSPWGRQESDATEPLHFDFSLSCIGEGNGNPLQCSCLENPRDSGAWWAAVYGVAQSQTRVKRLSISISINSHTLLMSFTLPMKAFKLREFVYLTEVKELLNSKLKPRQPASQACSLTPPLLLSLQAAPGMRQISTVVQPSFPKQSLLIKSVGCRNEQ